ASGGLRAVRGGGVAGRGGQPAGVHPRPLRAGARARRPRRPPAPVRAARGRPCPAAPRPPPRAADRRRAAGRAGPARAARRLGAGSRPRRPALTGPDALTSAERRVASLAADGLSNRQIAEHLFITQPTVETHLRHAFQKLGITSRAGLPAQLAAQRPVPAGL